MGVTNRNEVTCKNPENGSTESLLIPISSSHTSLVSTVSIENIPISRTSRRRRRQNLHELPVNIPQNAGRRRQRRFKAVAELLALVQKDECDLFLEHGIPHCSPFTIIIENPELEHIWDHFTAEDESEQAKLFENCLKKLPKPKSIVASYTNISSHIKMRFKMMRSLCELEKTESEIIEFFTNSPEDVYKNNNKSSFQRLLIHGVAQYYCLKSTSFDANGGKRAIKVENFNNYNNFCNKRLCTIVQDNHNKRV